MSSNVKFDPSFPNGPINEFPTTEGSSFDSVDLAPHIEQLLASTEPSPQPLSRYRAVFSSGEPMRKKFVDFLRTIFYQLDDRKVLPLMDEILSDPTKTDAQIYEELLARIGETKKRFPILHKIWSLFVLKRGMGKQAAQLLARFNPQKFHDYLEIYDRRYVKTIRSTTKMPLDGQVAAVCNNGSGVGPVARLEAGALFSRYPYNTQVDLNDADCTDPFEHPEQTHKPIGDQVPDASIDLVACLGGLHHIPTDRVDAFVESMHRTLRPGGVVLLRDHDTTTEEVRAIASVVHSFVNAADGVSLSVEEKEVREFYSLDDWTDFMENHGFTRISPESLVLTDDPTKNAMFAFVKTPKTLNDLKHAMHYLKNSVRPREGTQATWIEWGNVRFAKQYAEHIQTKSASSFDYIGHLRQHWQHFYHFVKESVIDPEQSKKDLFFSDSMAMNLFILLGTALQCVVGQVTSLPGMIYGRCKYGRSWRHVTQENVSLVEQYVRDYEKEYADNLDTIPFYAHNYLQKVGQIWSAFLFNRESLGQKLSSFPTLLSYTFNFLAMSAICAPIKMFYTQESNREPEKVTVIVHDPSDQIKEKDGVTKVLSTVDGEYKLLSVDRYRRFTEVMKELKMLEQVSLVQVGGQDYISVDVRVDRTKNPDEPENTGNLVYQMDDLSSPGLPVFRTYMVAVTMLNKFLKYFNNDEITYIHE